ncbi:MlaD family protein [uncultured Boseongicola sp.]|uniref:PqiB family protein n=1 Tax=uncultured Boseongicola sp. TaxID=1648499 RepID=UPI002632E4BD|nr:MlaD family protein [uncultured Boseongicola sp.]
MTDQPPEIPVQSVRQSLFERASVVWLVPMAALLVALGVAWQSYSDRGPVIEISFQSAAGMSPGETVLRYRDVDVGLVEDVAFSDNLDRVLATVRLDKDIASFVDADAQFWIIRPEVTARGVTGLDTVLSGVYIEGAWDGEPDGLVVRHEALGDPPLAAGGQAGLRIMLNASPGAALSEGAPILYKGIEVGRIGKPGLSDDGVNAQANAIVFEPYGKIITTATRFWDTSGFTFSIGTGGAELDFTSLASLIGGGVAFETIVSGGRPALDGAAFGLFADEGRARASLFDTSEGTKLNLTVVFRENFSGLAVGAPVELEGVRIGEVSSIRGIVDEDRFGDDAVRLLATLALLPSRLSLDVAEFDDPLDYFEQRVDAGLRARLVTATILTGGLKVEMIEVPDAPIELMDLSAEPYPILPSAQSEISDMTATAEGVFQRINALPIEELLVSAIGFLDAAETLVGGEDVRQVPGDVRGLIGDVRGLVGSQELQTLPAEVSALVGELQLAAADMRIVTASLSEADLVARLQGAVDSATAAATGIEISVAGVPELLTSLTALSDRVASLPVETMIAQVNETLASAEMLFASKDTQALPGALATALAEVEAAILELREGGAVRNLNQTLASAETAAAAIETAVAGLPSLAVRIETLVERAENTLSGVDQNSELSREARASLRDIRNAAKAFESLSRALERRPNSVIIGR